MATTTLCTQCFTNFGLRREAESLATERVETLCQNCRQAGGGLLDHDQAEQLMRHFFVHGSVPPDIGGYAPIYAFNRYRQDDEVEFASDLDADLALLCEFLGVRLFHYGPPLWKLGLTNYYNQLRGDPCVPAAEGKERKGIWREIFSRCTIRELEPGSRIFRARREGSLVPALSAEFDAPPKGLAGGGRYDSQDLPIFYGSDDVETCLHECRVTLSDWISLGVLTPTRSLRLLDLVDDIDDTAARTEFDRVDLIMMKLAYVGTEDYDLCRELAAEIREQGVDGFCYISYFAKANKKRLKNIALFGRPVESGLLNLISVNRVLLSNVNYEYSFGPHNDTSLPLDRADIQSLAGRMQEGSISLVQASTELMQLLSRKSDGPR